MHSATTAQVPVSCSSLSLGFGAAGHWCNARDGAERAPGDAGTMQTLHRLGFPPFTEGFLWYQENTLIRKHTNNTYQCMLSCRSLPPSKAALHKPTLVPHLLGQFGVQDTIGSQLTRSSCRCCRNSLSQRHLSRFICKDDCQIYLLFRSSATGIRCFLEKSQLFGLSEAWTCFKLACCIFVEENYEYTHAISNHEVA